MLAQTTTNVVRLTRYHIIVKKWMEISASLYRKQSEGGFFLELPKAFWGILNTYTYNSINVIFKYNVSTISLSSNYKCVGLPDSICKTSLREIVNKFIPFYQLLEISANFDNSVC